MDDPHVTEHAQLRTSRILYAVGCFAAFAVLAVLVSIPWSPLPELDTDLGLFHNKDTVFFPAPVTAPDGVRSFALDHGDVLFLQRCIEFLDLSRRELTLLQQVGDLLRTDKALTAPPVE